MQKQIFPNSLEWQSAPSENLVLNFPEKSRQKNYRQSMKTKQFVTIEKIFREEISRHIYPDFRYSCPYCGTLDVLVKASKSRWALEINCLDCMKVSLDPVNGGNTSCLCWQAPSFLCYLQTWRTALRDFASIQGKADHTKWTWRPMEMISTSTMKRILRCLS